MAISCTPADLVAASKCLCGIPKGNRELVMIYLLQQLAGLGNLTAAQLLDRAKCFCSLSDHDMKAIEVALLCTVTGGVPPCPPCPPSGGCTFQDMQVAWTPTNLKLGERIGFFTFADSGLPANLVFDQATNAVGWDIESDPNVQTISWPNLTSVDLANVQGGFIKLSVLTALTSVLLPLLTACAGGLTIIFNPLLTSLNLPSLTDSGAGISIEHNATLTSVSIPVLPTALSLSIDTNASLSSIVLTGFIAGQTGNYNLSANALPSSFVNSFLAKCVANAGFTIGSINLSGQTPAAPPTGQGIVDAATLSGRGVNVFTD